MATHKDFKGKRIGVLMGGRSSERDISLKSGQTVLASLLRSGYTVVGIDAGKDLPDLLKKERVDVAFIALHGRWGEDGTVQGLLEMMAVPYTGSGVLGSALAMDKCLGKLLLMSLEVPTPAYRICRSEKEADFRLPFVVKPARQGSTVGVSIVRKPEETKGAIETAFGYDDKLLLERYVAGREITVGIVNGLALPVVEVRPKSGFYDYTSKYTKGMTEYIVPAEIDGEIAEKARAEALTVWEQFELAGCVRVDMMLERDTPLVIDINTSPGMTETSLVPKAWECLGKTFDQLVEEILQGADLKA
jgi:D-alanine-D-alanine ligase